MDKIIPMKRAAEDENASKPKTTAEKKKKENVSASKWTELQMDQYGVEFKEMVDITERLPAVESLPAEVQQSI